MPASRKASPVAGSAKNPSLLAECPAGRSTRQHSRLLNTMSARRSSSPTRAKGTAGSATLIRFTSPVRRMLAILDPPPPLPSQGSGTRPAAQGLSHCGASRVGRFGRNDWREEHPMARRAYWKGYLRLSLVQCPIALYPATTEREKIHFHQINRKTGHRIRYMKVDAETGRQVDPDDIVMGYEASKGEYIEATDEELEAIALESRHIIDIDEFVPKEEIDDLYRMRPYYLAPNGDAGEDAFAVIRDSIERMGRVALARVVLTSREHVIKTKSGHFHPDKFEDHYESALRELVRRNQKGETIEPEKREQPSNVVNLMDALRRSVQAERRPPARSRGRRAAAERRRHPRRTAAKSRKAG